MISFLLNILNLIESWVRTSKKRICQSHYQKFLRTYSLKDGRKRNKDNVHYNSYEATNTLLIDALVESKIITPNDRIADIGCGAGIFLLYLASKGFVNLLGYEINEELFELCRINLQSFREKNKNNISISFHNEDALHTEYDDSVTCFYLFNTFYDKETYLQWLARVYRSYQRNKREIKIILLFPTVASMGAIRDCPWLHEHSRIIDKSHYCWRCVYFLVYQST